MKRLLIPIAFCMLVSFSFAQKKAVKEAKDALSSKSYSDARTLVKPALQDPETASDPETWKLAGDIEYKVFEVENNKQLMQQEPNEDKMYKALYSSYDPYVKADELGELPDEKGKIKNKVRKDISNNLRYAFPYFRNGGAINFEKKDYKKAADFFEKSWNIPYLPMFNNDKDKEFFGKQDTTIQEIKYYAAISAIYGEDHKRAIGLLKRITQEPFVQNSVYPESEVYELLADEYRRSGDSIAFIQALNDGAVKYPKSKYFIPNLVNEYIKAEQLDQALLYLDKAIANDPSNACDFNSVKASIYVNRQDFAKSDEYFKQAIASDAACERALEGLALSYIIRAQELKDEAYKLPNRKDQVEKDKEATELYRQAYPLLEKYKSLMVGRNQDKKLDDEIKAALIKLRNIYYNLTMNAEYDKTKVELRDYGVVEE